VLNLSAVLRSGLPNVERSYIVDSSIFSAPKGASIDFFVAVGAERREELDTVVHGRRFACWVIDHGPGGMLGQVREVVRAEAGLGAADTERRRVEDLERAALEALRSRASGGAARADGAFSPADVDAAVASTFGTGAEEELLRRVVELADLDATVTHDAAMERLAVSRATYFRYLRRARERVARTLVDGLGPDATWRPSR
jgi:predicted DNA-binding protein (UPF0251 family)